MAVPQVRAGHGVLANPLRPCAGPYLPLVSRSAACCFSRMLTFDVYRGHVESKEHQYEGNGHPQNTCRARAHV